MNKRSCSITSRYLSLALNSHVHFDFFPKILHLLKVCDYKKYLINNQFIVNFNSIKFIISTLSYLESTPIQLSTFSCHVFYFPLYFINTAAFN